MRALATAFGLGLTAAVAPCIIAANIAAVAYISRRLTNPKYTIFSSLLYTLGRILAYSAVGIVIIIVGHEIAWLSDFFKKGYYVLAPFFILAGLLTLFVDKMPFFRGGRLSSLGEKVAVLRYAGPLLLGAILALAFCPMSFILFFVLLMPIALQADNGLVLPAVFALATGLPVIAVGTLLSLGITRVTAWVNILNKSDRYIRMVMSIVFIGIGIYYIYLWVL
jgi:cytochrome c-type biogenesis protein